jgi:hypothetical protein
MQRKMIGKVSLFTATELMLLYNKLDYGFYWFGVCFREWYDTVLMGEYGLLQPHQLQLPLRVSPGK